MSTLIQSISFHVGFMPDAERLNHEIFTAYQDLREQDFLKRTHFFNGRYENLYLARNRIPAIEKILEQAGRYATEILNRPPETLRSGFWINDMVPGASTTEHDHDEDDELLSGVYYVKVPENSGKLIMLDAYSRTEVQSAEGMFVFFAPNILHAVGTNLSYERRISIGMNFGPKPVQKS